MVFRQNDFKIGSTRVIDDPHRTTVQLGGPTCDGQSQAGSARFGARTCFSFDETAENVGTRLLWNLRSEIDDIGDDGAEILVFVCFDKHRGIVRGMLERVRDDIGEQLAQAVLIACHLDIVGHMHFDVMRMPGIGDFQRFHGFVKKIGEIEHFDLQACRAGFHAGKIKKERDQIGQAVRLIEDAFQI